MGKGKAVFTPLPLEFNDNDKPSATYTVLTSESSRREVAFRDQRSVKSFSGSLDPGRAALLLIGTDGGILASYNWQPR